MVVEFIRADKQTHTHTHTHIYADSTMISKSIFSFFFGKESRLNVRTLGLRSVARLSKVS